MEVEPKSNQNSQPKSNKKVPRYQSYVRIMLIVINIHLANFYFGYVLTYINTLKFEEVITTFGITLEKQTARGVFNGIISVGACIGALIAKKLIHVFSRRNFLLFINVLAFAANCLIFYNNQIVFIIVRTIQGICIGFYTSTAGMMTAQISPIQISGSTGAFSQIFISMGVGTCYLFYYILLESVPTAHLPHIWYYVYGFPLITLTIQTIVILFIFPYETPKYFLMHHQKAKARALIAELYKPEFVQQVLKQKVDDIQQATKKQAAKAKRQSMTGAEVQAAIGRAQSAASMNSALSGVQIQQPDTPFWATFNAYHLHILRQFVGINAVVAYGGTIVQGNNPSLRPIVPFILNYQCMFGAVISIFLLAKLGRKTLLQIGTFGLTIALILITIGFFIVKIDLQASTGLILAGLFSYMFIYGASVGGIIWLYIAEIAQPSIVSIATTITWLFAALIVILFPIIKKKLPDENPVYLFLFFLIWTFVSLIFDQFILIQTKGKTQHQIQQEYKNLTLAKALRCDKNNQIKNQNQQINRANGGQTSQHIIELKKKSNQTPQHKVQQNQNSH